MYQTHGQTSGLGTRGGSIYIERNKYSFASGDEAGLVSEG